MTMRTSIYHLAPILAAIVLLITGPNPVHGQWTESPGHGWLQVSLFHQDTQRQFDSRGHVVQIFDEGHAINTSLYLTGAVGLFRGLDTWIQVPYHRLQYIDVAGDRVRRGLGEPKVFLRISPQLFGVQPVPVALRGGIKFPRELDVDAEIIPLGEGQRDWELMLELGHSFYPAPVYIQGWIGYRWRLINTRIDRKPGDEIFGFFAAGGSLGSFTWKFAVEGFRGKPPRIFGLPIESDRREFFQLLPKIGWDIGPGTVELGAQIPLLGRQLPAGPSLTLGYFFTWQ
jgi:hypothetical protein